MIDYNFLMESRLSPEQFQVINHLSRLAAAQGVNLYLVGGAVRDLTYGQQVTRDLDFAVEGNPQKILRQLESASQRKGRGGTEASPVSLAHIRYDNHLSSAEVVFDHGVRAEIAMSRSEVYAKPGRRPEVSPASIFDDLKRRDFSANAMAVSLHPNSRGLLLDPTNGAADIEQHELRVLHSRSFGEDPSRVYRLLRLGMRLGFKPEERTRTLLDSALENRVWQRLDPDQQAGELAAILREEHPERALKGLAHRGLLGGLDKKLTSSRIPYDRFAKIRSVAQTVPVADAFLLNFHSLGEKLGAGYKQRLAEKLIDDPKVKKMALGLETVARKLARVLGGSKAKLPSQVYTLLSGQPKPLLLFLLVNYPQTKIQSRLKSFLFKFPQVRARLPRAELQALGVEPGPKFEKIIERIFLDELDGKLTSHAQVVKAMRALAGIPEPKPAKPAKAAKPAKPATPTMPVKPAERAKAGAPAKPARPAAPAEPAKPAPPSGHVAEKPAAKKPAAKKPPAKKPSPATGHVAEKPAAKNPAAKRPPAKKPSAAKKKTKK